jgi:hypothetical protein
MVSDGWPVPRAGTAFAYVVSVTLTRENGSPKMSRVAFTILFGFGVALAQVACAGVDEDEPATGDDAEIKKATPGEFGGLCGGFAGITCKAGLNCKLTAQHPDASGTCAKATPSMGEPGGTCGGLAGILCKGGLECALEGNNPDASGTCKKGGPGLGEAGGFCGGIAGIPCKPGLQCSGLAAHPDASGTCK